MKRKKLQCSVQTFMLGGVLCLTLAACGAKQSSDMPASNTDSEVSTALPESNTDSAVSTALPVKDMNAKRVDENPYMAKSDANIHHDGYNTDSTDEVLPLGIYPEINVSYEKTNANASPAIYFDSYGHAVVPLLGGIAIRDLNAEETKTLGYFSPKQHDGGGYVIQSSYTFMDSENRIVCPTSNNHVLMLRATDEASPSTRSAATMSTRARASPPSTARRISSTLLPPSTAAASSTAPKSPRKPRWSTPSLPRTAWSGTEIPESLRTAPGSVCSGAAFPPKLRFVVG